MQKMIAGIIGILATLMGLFHLYGGGIQLFPATQQRAVHIGFALALIFLLYPYFKREKNEQANRQKSFFIKSGWNWVLNFLMSIGALAIGVYIFTNYIELTVSLNSPNTWTLVTGVMIILLTLEASRRVMGWGLPIISIVFLVYAFMGEYLPLMFAHSGFSFERIITQVGLSNEGLLGIPLGVSASYIILFVIFGSFLERSGAGQLFIDLAMALVGRFRGGPAKVAVVTSALFGSISGSPSSNVVTTGVLTIPLMKKAGYKPEYAGAVEAIASTGGMILPPVMGTVAFLIADFLQISYAEVALAALLPALLYYIAIFIMVDLQAARIGSKSKNSFEFEAPNIKKVLKEKGHLSLPLFLLIYLLFVKEATPFASAFWSIVTIPAFSFLRKETRMSLRDTMEALQQGVRLSLIVAAATACAGIVIGVINMTGLGLRFSGLLVDLSGGNLILLLVLTMLASLIMGMGLPPVGSYLLLAILAAPALTNLGIDPLAAHLFIFYYGTLSVITPPVAVCSYAASALAGADPTKTSLVAVRLGLIALIIPFMFVLGPSLILKGSILSILLSTCSAVIGTIALAIALEGYLKDQIGLGTRIALLIGALMMIHVGLMTDLIGLAIISISLLLETKKFKLLERTVVGEIEK